MRLCTNMGSLARVPNKSSLVNSGRCVNIMWLWHWLLIGQESCCSALLRLKNVVHQAALKAKCHRKIFEAALWTAVLPYLDIKSPIPRIVSRAGPDWSASTCWSPDYKAFFQFWRNHFSVYPWGCVLILLRFRFNYFLLPWRTKHPLLS